jgi:hypothetical protein
LPHAGDRAVAAGVVLVGALVILPALPGVASAARTKVLTAEYKGTYHFEDHFNSNGSVLNTVESYSWDEVETDTVEVSSGDIVRKRLSLVANGKLHQDATNGSSPIDYNCTIQQLKVPGDIRSSIVIEPDTHTGTLTGYGASVGSPIWRASS